MVVRRPDGAALLVAGYCGPQAAAADLAAVHTLAQIGEALLATGAAWQIRRLTAAAGERYAVDRASLKQHIDELVVEPARAAIVVLIGQVIATADGPALVTGPRAREYAEDATLPLSWIRDRLAKARAERLVVAMSARGEGTPGGWLRALAPGGVRHVVAADAPDAGHPIVDALLGGLCGDALDRRTGTITMASLCDHIAQQVPRAVLQTSSAAETLVPPPPFAGFWDVRSQLAQRPARARGGDDLDDLTGAVLPGSFRLDSAIARGSFGTVYRALQISVDRYIAVKVLNAGIDPRSEEGRLFVHEIRSVGRIKHTNVVSIYQADITHDGRLFFAMELLEGRDLQQVSADGVMQRDRAVELVRQLLAGLAAAHDAGLVHADVKPANAILVPVAPPADDPSEAAPGSDRSALAAGSGLPAVGARATAAGSSAAPVGPASAGAASDAARGGSARAGGEPSDAASSGAAERASEWRAVPTGRLVALAAAPPRAAARTASGHLAVPRPTERLVLVDFGFARLRAPDRPARSAGGTPPYMAPEQLREGRVDARSDLYSAALVLVYLLTGWRRHSMSMLAPPLQDLPDPELRAVLARALAEDPAERFPSARSFAAALLGNGGSATAAATSPVPLAPFRHLAPLTEGDRGRLFGREAELAELTEHALFRRCTIYTAPSGTGKTSMLRAGLVPRLEDLGVRCIYVPCRAADVAVVAEAIALGAATLADAMAAWQRQGGGKLVLVLDQLEAALGDPTLLAAVLALDEWAGGVDLSLVLSVREDYHARLCARVRALAPGFESLRLAPLTAAGAREAIHAPLAQARLAIEPELLDVLLHDLLRAAAAMGPELGWGAEPAVYPPHLQLACTVLHEALGPGEATITLAHYRRLGGFDAIVSEYLDRVIERELPEGGDAIARDLFAALVTAGQERAIRSEADLLASPGAKHSAAQVMEVLEVLRTRRLLVRVVSRGEPCWELVHDSLVRRVLAWLDRRAIARRRALELLRHHLRRSTPDAPSLLSRAELRELRAQTGVAEELEDEWRRRGPSADSWTPRRLVARSARAARRWIALVAATATIAVAAVTAAIGTSYVRSRQQEELEITRARDLGRTVLVLEPFDLATDLSRVPAPWRSGWSWQIHGPSVTDPHDRDPRPLDPELAIRGLPWARGFAVGERVEVRGGPAYVVVARAECPPAVVPIHFEGYRGRARPQELRVHVPTCAVSRRAMALVPAGPFSFGGADETPVGFPHVPPERIVDLPAFTIDITEVTNEMFSLLTVMPFTGIPPSSYAGRAQRLPAAAGRRRPVTFVDRHQARAFCRYLGKELPTSEQWVKAMRGGIELDGRPNPHPRRVLPGGPGVVPGAIAIARAAAGPADVATHPLDRSPYGVFDLAGNVMEWTSTQNADGPVVRGAGWENATYENVTSFMAIENPRNAYTDAAELGFRCAGPPPPP